jgi:hypothetical protein
VKFHSLHSSFTALVVVFGGLLLTACGGGGAGTNPNQGGPISISPSGENVTLYAGIPFTFSLQGGRKPYSITSSDQGILPMPEVVDAHFVTVVPNNPGVIDTGLQPGELPVRSIQINLRDSTGILITTEVKVAQNFLTGYGVRISPTTCPEASAGGFDPAAQACAGGESAIQMQATFNGALAGNRQFRMEVLRGNFSLRNPVTGQASQAITVTSDHTGSVLAILEVPANVPTQLGVLRVIDVATGVYADTVFTISAFAQSQNITPVPNEFTFTAALSTECGTGTANFVVFDGVAPYTATSANPNLLVTPSSSTNPGVFTLRAFNQDVCMSDATIIVTDARGGRGLVTVTTEAGTVTPPAPSAFTVAPTAITLGCGQSGSVTVIGGSGSYFTNSTSPATVTAVVSGNSVTLTRLNSGTGPASVVVSVSDGTDIEEVTATVPLTCP